MKNILYNISVLIISVSLFGCMGDNPNAADILGNPNYPAFSYGGYRQNTRDIAPTVDELKDDMRILSAIGIKLLRTYNTKQYPHAANLLKAIRELKEEDPDFEMYVMLGTWIECGKAWTSEANHNAGNVVNNTSEIEEAVQMVIEYPDIVKIIAVGNEAMVQWAVNYFVYPNVILKWVNYLRDLREKGEIPTETWITSSDNYESWGGGAIGYQTPELEALIKAVDFVSLHTYPFHDSHYNPAFWGVPEEEEDLDKVKQIEAAMIRAKNYAISQYQEAVDYMASVDIKKPIHIGETGWATVASSSYGTTGSKAADEYKEKLYYQHMRSWTTEAGMSCFYFEAFDERWKDQGDSLGSENHFGLINLKGEAKYALWDMVDEGVFDGLTRNDLFLSKTYGGGEEALLAEIEAPPLLSEMGILEIVTVNDQRRPGEKVTEGTYVIVNEDLLPDGKNEITYPSATLKLNAWEGTCGIEMNQEGVIEVATGTGAWWGCALEMTSGNRGENLSEFANGKLNYEIRGNTASTFKIGFQTGTFEEGNQVNNFVTFGPGESRSLSEGWKSFSIPISELEKGADLGNVTGILFLLGDSGFDGGGIEIRNISYSK